MYVSEYIYEYTQGSDRPYGDISVAPESILIGAGGSHSENMDTNSLRQGTGHHNVMFDQTVRFSLSAPSFKSLTRNRTKMEQCQLHGSKTQVYLMLVMSCQWYYRYICLTNIIKAPIPCKRALSIIIVSKTQFYLMLVSLSLSFANAAFR